MGVDSKLFGVGLLGPLKPPSNSVLKRDFLFPPFSVWNTREGQWQNRKRLWIKLGIESEVGRGDKLVFGENLSISQRTSIFDPVVTELIYRWFCPPEGIIIDPFAGGSVRGIVASCMGHKYWGIELRKEQVLANREQINEQTQGKYRPKWNAGDSLKKISKAPEADLIFSCPPYGDLEKYSDNEFDLSNMSHRDFLKCYYRIIQNTCARLKQDRFACFVVANFRDKDGHMRDLVGETVRAFGLAGLNWYNDIILVNPVGSGCFRARRTFVNGSGKVVKLHQNILVFIKGSAKKAAAKFEKGEGCT